MVRHVEHQGETAARLHGHGHGVRHGHGHGDTAKSKIIGHDTAWTREYIYIYIYINMYKECKHIFNPNN